MTPQPIPSRIARLLPMLGSPVDGEALAACRALERALTAAKLDLHDLAAAVVTTETPVAPQRPASAYALAAAIRGLDQGRLTERERAFVLSMFNRGFKPATAAQAAWLADIHAKLTGAPR